MAAGRWQTAGRGADRLAHQPHIGGTDTPKSRIERKKDDEPGSPKKRGHPDVCDSLRTGGTQETQPVGV